MATITFTGPSVEDPSVQASKVITLPDAVMAATMQAICALNGYTPTIPDPDNPGQSIENPVGPAQFAVQKSVEHWRAQALTYAQKQAQDDIAAALASKLGPIQAGFAAVTVVTGA